MTIRVRKLIGLVAMLAWLFIYALIAARLAIDILPEAHWGVKLLYYAIAGLSWTLPLFPLIRWMQRPDLSPEPDLSPQNPAPQNPAPQNPSS